MNAPHIARLRAAQRGVGWDGGGVGWTGVIVGRWVGEWVGAVRGCGWQENACDQGPRRAPPPPPPPPPHPPPHPLTHTPMRPPHPTAPTSACPGSSTAPRRTPARPAPSMRTGPRTSACARTPPGKAWVGAGSAARRNEAGVHASVVAQRNTHPHPTTHTTLVEGDECRPPPPKKTHTLHMPKHTYTHLGGALVEGDECRGEGLSLGILLGLGDRAAQLGQAVAALERVGGDVLGGGGGGGGGAR